MIGQIDQQAWSLGGADFGEVTLGTGLDESL
jgi:hypothetical protein